MSSTEPQRADCTRWSGPAVPSAYHGLHRLPALGLGSRQEEILGISPEIHLQIDVEVHGVACLRLNAYYSRRTRSVFPGQQGLFGLISPIRSTVTYPKGDEAYFVFTSASRARPPAPCVRNSERHFRFPSLRKNHAAECGALTHRWRTAAHHLRSELCCLWSTLYCHWSNLVFYQPIITETFKHCLRRKLSPLQSLCRTYWQLFSSFTEYIHVTPIATSKNLAFKITLVLPANVLKIWHGNSDNRNC